MGITRLGQQARWRPVVAVPLVLCAALAGAAEGGEPRETRCGWFVNPTPANMTLIDRDGEWVIGEMGGHQAHGDWDWPKFGPGEWKKTNGAYGYGCSCFRLSVDATTHRVLFIEKAWKKSLSACENDRALKGPQM